MAGYNEWGCTAFIRGITNTATAGYSGLSQMVRYNRPFATKRQTAVTYFENEYPITGPMGTVTTSTSAPGVSRPILAALCSTGLPV